MRSILLISTFLLICFQAINSQTVLWQEDFESYSIQTGICGIFPVDIGDYPALTPFTIDKSDLDMDTNGDYVRISYVSSSSTNDSHLEARDLDGDVFITFNAVNINGETGDVTIDIADFDFNITSSNYAWSGDEYADISYSLDNGNTFVLIEDHNNVGITGHTFMHQNPGVLGEDYNTSLSVSFDPGSSTSVILKIGLYNTGANEEFEIDDISISRNGVTLWNEDFEGYTIASGIEGSTSAQVVQTGDYPGQVSKWTLTPASTSQLLNNKDFAKVSSVSINGTQVLKYNDVNDKVTFETEAIDISGRSEVDLAIDIVFDEATYEVDEYVDIYYSLDGAPFVLAQNNGSGHTYSGNTYDAASKEVAFSHNLNALSASTLKLRIEASTTSASRDYEFDNIIISTPTSTDIETAVKLETSSIYPNPIKDNTLFIETQLSGNKYIQIYNTQGVLVYQTTTKENHINLENVGKGNYLLIVTQQGESISRKIIID